ncbi:MAG: peptidylprolyl isomerase [Clostridiales bacterium]|nr:peptidylprolyl isomerase [Clostridiales bacterium]
MKYVRIEMEDGGVMRGELYPEIAPETVANFEKLVKDGFYDGLTFHRVIPGFMIQGGCPKGNGTGGPGWTIKGEFTSNGFENNLKHTTGVMSMARTMFPDSAGSQFFIMVHDAPFLDGEYAAFGKIIEGQEVADGIVNTPRDMNDKPKKAQRMAKVTIEEE